MSYSVRFRNWLLRTSLAGAGVLTEVTGSACPCMSYKNRNSYSEEWHRQNSGETDCNGTGLISTTTTTVNFKGIFCAPALVGRLMPTAKEFMEAIGEIQKDDMFLWGAVNSTTSAVVELAGQDEYYDYITYNSNKYIIRDVSDLPGQVGQVAHLVRKKN